jgi:hypothetical protein
MAKALARDFISPVPPVADHPSALASGLSLLFPVRRDAFPTPEAPPRDGKEHKTISAVQAAGIKELRAYVNELTPVARCPLTLH